MDILTSLAFHKEVIIGVHTGEFNLSLGAELTYKGNSGKIQAFFKNNEKVGVVFGLGYVVLDVSDLFDCMRRLAEQEFAAKYDIYLNICIDTKLLKAFYKSVGLGTYGFTSRDYRVTKLVENDNKACFLANDYPFPIVEFAKFKENYEAEPKVHAYNLYGDIYELQEDGMFRIQGGNNKKGFNQEYFTSKGSRIYAVSQGDTVFRINDRIEHNGNEYFIDDIDIHPETGELGLGTFDPKAALTTYMKVTEVQKLCLCRTEGGQELFIGSSYWEANPVKETLTYITECTTAPREGCMNFSLLSEATFALGKAIAAKRGIQKDSMLFKSTGEYLGTLLWLRYSQDLNRVHAVLTKNSSSVTLRDIKEAKTLGEIVEAEGLHEGLTLSTSLLTAYAQSLCTAVYFAVDKVEVSALALAEDNTLHFHAADYALPVVGFKAFKDSYKRPQESTADDYPAKAYLISTNLGQTQIGVPEGHNVYKVNRTGVVLYKVPAKYIPVSLDERLYLEGDDAWGYFKHLKGT